MAKCGSKGGHVGENGKRRLERKGGESRGSPSQGGDHKLSRKRLAMGGVLRKSGVDAKRGELGAGDIGKGKNHLKLDGGGRGLRLVLLGCFQVLLRAQRLEGPKGRVSQKGSRGMNGERWGGIWARCALVKP